MADTPTSGHAYTDPRYFVPHTFQFPTIVDAVLGGTGIVGAASHTNLFRMPFKAKLKKFGVIPCTGTNMVCSTTTGFALRTVEGTNLAKFIPGKCTLPAGVASGCAPQTATTIAANRVVQPCIMENAGTGGSVIYFMDYEQQYVGS